MKTPSIFCNIKYYIALLMLVFLFPVSPAGAFMEDVDREKPRPVFTREKDTITAKLIPRAKSNSITIDFRASEGGRLESVDAFDITKALDPQINMKDFRSELFEIHINGVAPGGDAVLKMTSDFFTSSTSFWVFNKNREVPWMDSRAKNSPLEKKVFQFSLQIKDGGELDSDGVADGRITIIGGPMDSFWGYVLGTLFIRFFGVFLVLTVLMIGMLFSGRIFQKLLKTPPPEQMAPPLPNPAQTPEMPIPEPSVQAAGHQADVISPEMAAAIGLALDLTLRRTPPPKGNCSRSPGAGSFNAWGQEGRRQIMADRQMVFNRIKN